MSYRKEMSVQIRLVWQVAGLCRDSSLTRRCNTWPSPGRLTGLVSAGCPSGDPATRIPCKVGR